MPHRRPLPWRPDSHQTASGKPGAVHWLRNDPALRFTFAGFRMATAAP
jgi:hypothetical protein